MLAMTPLPPVRILAPLDPVAWLLRVSLIRVEPCEGAEDGEGGHERRETTPGSRGREGAGEGIEASWVHCVPPLLGAAPARAETAVRDPGPRQDVSTVSHQVHNPVGTNTGAQAS